MGEPLLLLRDHPKSQAGILLTKLTANQFGFILRVIVYHKDFKQIRRRILSSQILQRIFQIGRPVIQIGRASCRERVEISAVVVSLTRNEKELAEERETS